MAKRICLLTSDETDCKGDCFSCKCGGAEATKDMYVSINNVQRVCAITGGAADTDEGEYIAEVIRNNLENMVIPAADVQPVKHGKWEQGKCTNCEKKLEDLFEGDFYYDCEELHFCPNCGARMDGDTNG